MIPGGSAQRLMLRTALGLLLLVLIYACGRVSTTPEATATQGVLLTDTFSPPNPAWVRFESAESAVTALAGELYLDDFGKGIAVYTPLLGKIYTEARISVDVRYVQGTMNNWMGVICGHQDDDNYHLAVISADGYYLLLSSEEGLSRPLSGPESSQAIITGKAENRLEVVCQDGMLALSVNGTPVAQYLDTSLRAKGQIALFADAIERGTTTTVAFDNLVIAIP